jgi:hypothetical protein
VVFRIRHTRQIYRIGKYFDLGQAGIEIPQVNTPEGACDAVEELSETDIVVCFRHFYVDNRQKYRDMGVRALLERPSL